MVVVANSQLYSLQQTHHVPTIQVAMIVLVFRHDPNASDGNIFGWSQPILRGENSVQVVGNLVQPQPPFSMIDRHH